MKITKHSLTLSIAGYLTAFFCIQGFAQALKHSDHPQKKKNEKGRIILSRRAEAPKDPTKLDCRHPWFQSPNSARSLLSWGKTYKKKVQEHDAPHSYPIHDCMKSLRNFGTAACKDRSAMGEFKTIARLCRAWFKRAKTFERAKAAGKPIPPSTYSPKQAKKHVKSRLRWAKTYERQGMKTANKAMKMYEEALSFDPNNRQAAAGYDKLYAAYYGVGPEVARKNRTESNLEGRLARWPRHKVYSLAIDELLGKHHKVEGTTPKLGLNYLDVHYLVTRVYEPVIKNNIDEFRFLKCSSVLSKKRKDFRDPATKKELADSRGLCSKGATKIRPKEVLRDHRMRMQLIQILSKKTKNPKETLEEAGRIVANQVGAEQTKVCWLYENPYPEKHQPTAGKNAKCNAWGSDSTHNTRPGYYNFVYTPHPIKKKTKLQIWEARRILAMAGLEGDPLDKRLAKLQRKAPEYKCVAFTVSFQRERKPKGGFTKTRFRGVGGNKEISCRRIKRNRQIVKTMPDHWNNFYDTLVGGAWKGSWQDVTATGWYRIRRGRRWIRRRTTIRKVREGVVFVRRKI